MERETIRGNMRAERHRRGLTIQEVATLLGCSPQIVSRWELGLTTPSPKFLLMMAKIYQLPPDYLLEIGIVKTHKLKHKRTKE